MNFLGILHLLCFRAFIKLVTMYPLTIFCPYAGKSEIFLIIQTEVWAAVRSKYSSVLGKLRLQMKFLSTVASFISFNHLRSFLVTSCKLLYFWLKKKFFYGLDFFIGVLPRLCSSHFDYCRLWKSPHPHILLWYLKATEKFMKLNIGSFCCCEKNPVRKAAAPSSLS